jgi:hypothetical protein
MLEQCVASSGGLVLRMATWTSETEVWRALASAARALLERNTCVPWCGTGASATRLFFLTPLPLSRSRYRSPRENLDVGTLRAATDTLKTVSTIFGMIPLVGENLRICEQVEVL